MRAELIAYFLTIADKTANAAELAESRARYARRASRLALAALDLPLYPGKKPDDLTRPAANDTERDLAIKYVLEHDDTLRKHREAMEQAQRSVNLLRSREKNYRMIARLVIATGED